MTAMGMPGVSTWNFGEAFAHLYLDSVAMNHNSLGRGYETWGNGTAETLRRTVPPSTNDGVVSSPAAAARLRWSARDNLNYHETGVRCARSRRERKIDAAQFLQQELRLVAEGIGRAAVRIRDPRESGGSPRVAQLVGRLLGQHIEVARAVASLTLKEGQYPAGTYVVRFDQPYRNYAVDLLTPQHYPKTGVNLTTMFRGPCLPTTG